MSRSLHPLEAVSESIEPQFEDSALGGVADDPVDGDPEKLLSIAVWILGALGIVLITTAIAALFLAAQALSRSVI